jgi:hypothetical protein
MGWILVKLLEEKTVKYQKTSTTDSEFVSADAETHATSSKLPYK